MRDPIIDGAGAFLNGPTFDRDGVTIYCGDCLAVLSELANESVNCCVTSPPYWCLRDYGTDGQLGIEETPAQYVEKMVDVFREVRRVLRDDGTLWLNLGDTYNAYNGGAGPSSQLSKTQSSQRPQLSTGYGLQCKTRKPKDLLGIPWSVAFALRSDGWYLRQDIIWHKPNPMPESVTDRCTKAHEYVFLLSKSQRYYFDQDAIAEKSTYAGITARFNAKRSLAMGRKPSGNEKTSERLVIANERNKRSVWTVTTQPYKGAHFAVFPEKLIEPCILAGCPEGGTVLDPFLGSGTTAAVAQKLGRKCVGIELNPDYVKLCINRFEQRTLFHPESE